MREGLIHAAQNTGYADGTGTATYDLIDATQSKVTLQQRWVNENSFSSPPSMCLLPSDRAIHSE